MHVVSSARSRGLKPPHSDSQRNTLAASPALQNYDRTHRFWLSKPHCHQCTSHRHHMRGGGGYYVGHVLRSSPPHPSLKREVGHAVGAYSLAKCAQPAWLMQPRSNRALCGTSRSPAPARYCDVPFANHAAPCASRSQRSYHQAVT